MSADSLYINFTSKQRYDEIKDKIINTVNPTYKQLEEIEQHNHTLYILNETGLPSNTAGSLNMCVGNQIITDIVNLNQFKTVDIEENQETGWLTVRRKDDQSIDTLICNKNKLYIYCEYRALVALTFFNIYFYSESNQAYIPITRNGATTGIFNFIQSKDDIDDKSLWTPKTLVYYPQS